VESSRKTPLLSLHEVTKTYRDGNVRALVGVSLEIPPGQFVSITGPSGCGKSTLLHLLGALDLPTSGQVFFRGVPQVLVPQLPMARWWPRQEASSERRASSVSIAPTGSLLAGWLAAM